MTDINGMTAEDRHRQMYDAIPLCCSYWDDDFQIIDCNFEALKLFDIKEKQEFLGIFFEISPEYQQDGKPSRSKWSEMLKVAFDKGRVEFEWTHRKLNGELIPTEISLVRIDIEGGRSAVVGYTRDMREARSAEAKTEEAQKRMQLMFNASPLCCTFWDENLNPVDCNLEAVRMFGVLSKQEYLDRFNEFSPEYQPDGRLSKDAAPKSVARAFERGRYVFEWMHQNLKGEPIPTEVKLVRFDEDKGRRVVLAFMRDLREEKAAEAKVKEAQKRMQLMFDESPLCCTFWDENLNHVDCNLEAVRMFGVSSKQEYLDRFNELSPEYQPDGRLSKEAVPQSVARAFERGRYVFEWMHQNLKGEPIPAEVTLVKVDTGNERGVVLAFMRDLREEKAAEARIKEADERMRVMFDIMPFGCNYWDINLNLIDCNNETLRLFNIEDKMDFLNRYFDYSPKYQPDGKLSRRKGPDIIKYAFKYGRLVIEWLYRKLDGELIPAEITLIRTKHGDRYIVVVYIRDLRELKDKTDKLEVAEKLAFSDSLTGIHNRRFFMQYADQEFNVQSSPMPPIGIIMLDIDHFKKVNDTYGHEAGDEALKQVTITAQGMLREADLFARYGGEEFIVLAQHLNLDSLTRLAWRVCKKVENLEFFYNETKIPLTISAGVAIRKNMAHTIEEVIKHADAALYKAKANGRNRVEVYNE